MTTASIHEDIRVYPRKRAFRASGMITGDVLMESRSADDVLQAAVRHASASGGAITLHRGSYPMRREIRLGSRVWLRGSGRGTILRVMDGHASGCGITCSTADGVVISDLSVVAESRQAVAGIVLDDCGDCQIRDTAASGFSQYGILLKRRCFLCEVKSCKASDNWRANIGLQKMEMHGRGGDFPPNLISGCTIYGGLHGIEVDNGIVSNIIACQVFQAHGHAYYVHRFSNSVLISGCRSFQCDGNAILVKDSHEFNASSNILCWHRGHGIELHNVSWASINGNEVIDSGCRHAEDAQNGILLRGNTQGVQVTGNSIFNWGDQVPMKHGLFETSSCRKNLFTGNNVNYCLKEAMVSNGRGSRLKHNVTYAEKGYLRSECQPMFEFDMKRIQEFTRQLYKSAHAHPDGVVNASIRRGIHA